MKPPHKLAYSRSIKLGPAVGDWTTIQFRDPSLDEIQVSSVQNPNFNSLPKEKLRYVHYMHYRLAEKIATQFSKDMDIKVELHTIGASQMTYGDFVDLQADPVVQTNLFIENLGKITVLFDWGLADSVVNRLLGGKGEETLSSTFSEIEQQVLQAEVEQLLPDFVQTWKGLIPQDAIKLELLCGAFTQDKKYSLRESYVVFAFHLYFGKGELRKVIFAYPSELLRKLLTLKQSLPDSTKKRVYLSQETLKSTKVRARGVLGHASLTMKELKHLQVGDIIPLATSLQSPLDLVLGDKTKFSAQAGSLNHKLCMQLIFLDAPQQQIKKPLAEIKEEPVSAPLLYAPDSVFSSPPVIEQEEVSDNWEDLPTEFQPISPQAQQPVLGSYEEHQADDIEDPLAFETETDHHDQLEEQPEEDDFQSYEEEDPQDAEDTLDFADETSHEDAEEHEEDIELQETDEHSQPKEEDEFSWDDLDTNF